MSVSISVIIPTWNRRALLAECIESLARQSLPPSEIVVVDDGSTDDTRDWLAERHPGVRAIALEWNRGFAGAANAGIRAATGEYLVLLNNDMTVDARFLERLAARADDGADMVAPLILWKDDPETVYSAGDRQRADGRPEPIGFRQPRATFEPPGAIFGVSAGAALYRREVFERVGHFDERFVAYFEDSDLNFRARLAGLAAVLEPEAVAYHVGSASLGGKTWWRTRQCCRNHMLLVWKNMPTGLVARHFPAIHREQMHQVFATFDAARGEFGALKAAALVGGVYWDWLRLAPGMLRSRYAIQRHRALTARALDAMLTHGWDL